jgi:hypothetical protein
MTESLSQNNEPAENERPTDEQLDDLFVEIDGSGETQSWRAFARAVLACWGAAAPAADGEVGDLVLAMKELAYDVAPYTCDLLNRAADLLERQAAAAPVARLPEDAQVIEPANRTILVPVPAPIPVSERLPEKAEMTDDDEVWVEYPGGEYPLGDTGDYDWEPHKWILSPIAKFTIRENRRWLPAHALPLPEVK